MGVGRGIGGDMFWRGVTRVVNLGKGKRSECRGALLVLTGPNQTNYLLINFFRLIIFFFFF